MLDRFMLADLIGLLDEVQHSSEINKDLRGRIQFVKEYLEFELDYLTAEEKDIDMFND